MRLHHRITAATATAALALSAAFVAAAPATATDSATSSSATAASTATFDGVSISGLKKKITVPKSGTKDYKFQVNINGSPADTSYLEDSNGDGLKVDYLPRVGSDFPKTFNLKSRVKSPSGPLTLYPSKVVSGAKEFTLRVSSDTSPGLYEVRVPVRQRDYTSGTLVETTKVAKLRVQILANKKSTRAKTTYWAPSWKTGGTAKITFLAPAYQKGAKVTLQYKAPKSKWKKVTTKKLKVKKGANNATAVLKTKKLRPGHKIRFKVSKVKWAPAYKTKTDKIVRR